MQKFSTTPAQEEQRRAFLERRRGDLKQGNRKIKYGRIMKQRIIINKKRNLPVLQVQVRTDDYNSSKRQAPPNWYGLAYPIDFIAHVFGNDLVGKRCKVEYTTINADNGVVFIVGNQGFTGDMDKATTVASFGTSLAPAGSL